MPFQRNRQSPSCLVPVEEEWEALLSDRYNADCVSRLDASE